MASFVFPSSRTALLLIDVVNLFDFPGGGAFARRCLPAAGRIVKLRDRAHRAGIPVVYVNDNFGRWRSDFKTLFAVCSETGRPGARIAQLLRPTPRDFFVLKPHLSGFHETPLHMLLQSGGVRAVVPSDCVASEQDRERRHALTKVRKFFDANTSASARVRLGR